MLAFCSNCYVVGHLTVDCENEKSTCWDYIAKLKNCNIPDDFFGSWIDHYKSLTFQTSTPRTAKGTNIKAQFLSFMQEFVRNPNSISTPPQSPTVASRSTPTGSGPGPNTKKNHFKALHQWTPQIQAQIDAEKLKQQNKKAKNLTTLKHLVVNAEAVEECESNLSKGIPSTHTKEIF
jgi:hypothetical protein